MHKLEIKKNALKHKKHKHRRALSLSCWSVAQVSSNASQEVLNGFYDVTLGNGAYYQGLFKSSQRLGPGVLTYLQNMCQDVGWWNGGQLIRLCRKVNILYVPSLKCPQLLSSNAIASNDLSTEILNVILPPEKGVPNYKLCKSRKSRTDLAISNFDVETKLIVGDPSLYYSRSVIADFTNKYMKIFGNFNVHPNGEVMAQILDYTFLNLDETTCRKVTKYLVEAPKAFSKCGFYESACIDFLLCCSSGNLNYIRWLNLMYNMDLNVCDGNGNNGVIFATARDKLNVLMYLASSDADFNLPNDEGLTALLIVLMRFIAELRGIQTWYTAFKINTINFEYADESFDDEKRMVYSDCQFYLNPQKPHHEEKMCELNMEKFFILYGLNIPPHNIQTFQKPYFTPTSATINDKYIFDFRLKQPVRVRRECRVRKITYNTFLRLTVIFNTMVVLLHNGANPLLGRVPLPPIFLALFTESSDVVNLMIKFGADPTIRLPSYYNINVLHALVSMRPGKYMVNICKALLSVEFDLDIRTDPNHWIDQHKWIMGNYKGVSDCGKTALHIIAMRNDFKSDKTWLCQVAHLLINKGANYATRYLGHVPLTLCMLRGNVAMMKTLLKYGASPNQTLGSRMGNPITVLLLNRYRAYLPHINVCLMMMQLLFNYGGDPLLGVYGPCNTIEFLCSERISLSKKIKHKHQIRPQKQTKSYIQMKLRLMILQQAHYRLLRHYQSLIFLMLYQAAQRGEKGLEENKHYLVLMRFLRIRDSIAIARYMITLKIFDPKKYVDSNTIFYVLLLVKNYGARVKNSVNVSHNFVTSMKPLEAKIGRPEFDCNFDKYRVCLSCCMVTGKTLLACPTCGIVYFCSKRCEFYGKYHKLHPCKKLFYEEEFKQYKFCLNRNMQYEGVHDDFYNNIRKDIYSIPGPS